MHGHVPISKSVIFLVIGVATEGKHVVLLHLHVGRGDLLVVLEYLRWVDMCK